MNGRPDSASAELLALRRRAREFCRAYRPVLPVGLHPPYRTDAQLRAQDALQAAGYYETGIMYDTAGWVAAIDRAIALDARAA